MPARDEYSGTTPAGRAVFPHLHKPDTKYQERGVYKTKLAFEGAAATQMANLLDEYREEAYEAAVEEYMERKEVNEKVARKKVDLGYDPYEEELDDEGEETGRILVNFKMYASGERDDGTRWTQAPPVFDAEGTPVESGLRIGSGSLLKIAYTPNFYYTPMAGAGVSLWLNAIQVLDLQTWGGGGNADDYGFEAEDGFSADEVDEGNFASSDESDEETLEDEDEGEDVFQDADF